MTIIGGTDFCGHAIMRSLCPVCTPQTPVMAMARRAAARPTYKELRAENERLRAALRTLVDNVLDYERVNNLSPNPGRKYCWDTVAKAVEILNQQQTETK